VVCVDMRCISVWGSEGVFLPPIPINYLHVKYIGLVGGAICAIPRRVLVDRRSIVYIRILCSFRLHASAGRLKVLLH